MGFGTGLFGRGKQSDEDAIKSQVEQEREQLPFKFESMGDCRVKEVAEWLVGNGFATFQRSNIITALESLYPDIQPNPDRFMTAFNQKGVICMVSERTHEGGRFRPGTYRFLRECEGVPDASGGDDEDEMGVKGDEPLRITDVIRKANGNTKPPEPTPEPVQEPEANEPEVVQPIILNDDETVVKAKVTENTKPEQAGNNLSDIGERVLDRRRTLEQEIERCDGEICRMKALKHELLTKKRELDELIDGN